MKHLRMKRKKMMRVGGWDIDVTKYKSCLSLGNNLFIKKYSGEPNSVDGVAIRMRGQSEIIMDNDLAGNLALVLREYANPKLYTAIELCWIVQKFKYNKDVVNFVKRIMKNEVSSKEIDKIVKDNKTKEKVADRLTGNQRLGSLFG